MTTELVGDGHWKVSGQSGNSMATLWNAWGRTRDVFWRLDQNGPRGQKERSEEKPEGEEVLLPHLAHELEQIEPSYCSERCLCGKPTNACVEMQHERGVFWTWAVESENSNHLFLLGLHYMLTLEILSPQSCSLTRHLLDCLQGLLEISCVLFFSLRYWFQYISVHTCNELIYGGGNSVLLPKPNRYWFNLIYFFFFFPWSFNH